MQKHQPPMNRFAAVDYDTIDALDDMIVKGLLMTLIRQKPGEDMTIEKLAGTHKQGRKTLEAAMRRLVEMGLVVKLKIQNASNNRWRTVFTVSDREISREFIQDWIDEITDARAIRVEPARLDPRLEGKNGTENPLFPTAAIGPVGGNEEKSQVRTGSGNGFPTAAIPTVGDATLAGAAVKEEKVFTQYGGDEVAENENSLTASGGKAALAGDESELQGSRPSIEEITGAGSSVAFQERLQRPPGHTGACICLTCQAVNAARTNNVPQQPRQGSLDRLAGDLGFSFDDYK